MNNDFALFIDELRESRNITRDEFVEGIISLRSYYRFINGESSLKADSISKLLDKLQLSNIQTYEYFSRFNNTLRTKLSQIYDLYYTGYTEKALSSLNKLNPEKIDNISDKKYYDFLKTIILIKLNRTDKNEGIERILKIVDYPNLLKKKVLSSFESNVMVYCSSYLIRMNDYRFAEYSYNLLVTNNKLDLANEQFKNYSIALFSSSSQGLGKIGKIEQSYEVALKGIHLFNQKGNFSVPTTLFYIQALNEKHLFKDKRYLKTLKKVISLLNLNPDHKYVEQYKKTIKYNFEDKEILDLLK